MTDAEYIAYEFNKARGTLAGGTGGEEKIHVKVRGDDGESRWVGVPAQRLDAITAAASGGPDNGYRDRAGIDNRANSALLSIERIIADRSIPAAVRLVLVAEIMNEEPVLTDGSPAARSVRREIAAKRGR
jgi:hypothetical protein